MEPDQTSDPPESRQREIADATRPPAAAAIEPKAVFADAVRQHQAGQFAQAAVGYRIILAAQPNHVDSLHMLGLVTGQTGDKEGAVELIGQAIALNPNLASAHCDLGIMLKGLDRLDDAIASYQRAVALNPDYAEAHYNLGIAHQAMGKFKEATVAFERAIEIKPGFAPAHYNLGNALAGHGAHEDAVTAFERAIESRPRYFEAYSNLGNALKELNRLDEAIAAYRAAIALKPDHAASHSNLGSALNERCKLDEAVASHQTAIALKPDLAQAHNNLGVALMNQGKPDKARACFRRAIEIAPDDAKAHFNHATVHKFSPGDPELERLKEMLEIADMTDDHRNRIRFALGKAHDDLGRHAEAFSYYSAANQGSARQNNFDAVRHRDHLLDIRSAFPEGRVFATKPSVDVECVPVFVVGMSRSGKTLIESLLSRHEGAHGTGESEEWDYALNTVAKMHSKSGTFPDCMDYLSDDDIRNMGSEYMENLVKEPSKSKLLINTSSGIFRYIGMLFQALPRVKVIYCQREPIDNCLFVYFKSYARGHYYSYDFADVASCYADYTNMMAHWLQLYGDRILAVRYEDLVRNPAGVGARIYEFCGLDYDPAAVENEFTTEEIGHWKHYEPYLDPLRQALGGLIRPSDGDATTEHRRGTNE